MTVTAGALRADPGFRRYLAARVVSTAGTLITAVVLPVLTYRLTGSAAWSAAVVVAEALPYLLLGPVLAAPAARRRRTAVLLHADLAGAALLGGIPLAWWLGVLTSWQVVAVAGGLQAAFLLQETAHHSTVQALVGPGSTAAGGAALRGATGLIELMVPPLAGLAVTVVAPAGLLALDAVSFLASALLVQAALRRRPAGQPAPGPAPGPPAPPGPVRAAVRLLRGTAPARRLVLAGTLHAAAGAAYLAMLLPWADQQLGVPPAGDARLALVLSCWGLGAIVGYSVYPALIDRFGPARLARRARYGSPACGLAVLLSTHWLPALLGALLWGAAQTVTMKTVRAALGPAALPAVALFWRGMGPVAGAALAGAVAVTTTPRAGLAVGVVLLAVAALLLRRGVGTLPPGSPPAEATAAGRAPGGW